MKKLNTFDWIVATLLIIGGLNWGIIGFFGINVVGAIFGEMSAITRIIYALVGLSSIYALFIPSRMSSGEYMHGEPMEQV
jgi:uncharacterized protein